YLVLSPEWSILKHNPYLDKSRVRARPRRRIVRVGKAVVTQPPLDPPSPLERCPYPARNDKDLYVLCVRRAAGGVGPRPATHLICPQRVHFRLEWQRISLPCLADKHEMPLGQHFHPAVPREGLILSILRYRHEFPNPAHLTAGIPVHGGLQCSIRAREYQPGCRNGEHTDVAEKKHGGPRRCLRGQRAALPAPRSAG